MTVVNQAESGGARGVVRGNPAGLDPVPFSGRPRSVYAMGRGRRFKLAQSTQSDAISRPPDASFGKRPRPGGSRAGPSAFNRTPRSCMAIDRFSPLRREGVRT